MPKKNKYFSDFPTSTTFSSDYSSGSSRTTGSSGYSSGSSSWTDSSYSSGRGRSSYNPNRVVAGHYPDGTPKRPGSFDHVRTGRKR